MRDGMDAVPPPGADSGQRRWGVSGIGRGIMIAILLSSMAFFGGRALRGRQALPMAHGGSPMVHDPLVGQPAPDFTLPTLDGRTVTLSSLHGQPVVLNFWATWCIPCRAEMPALMQAATTYGPDGLVVLAVNLTAQDSLPAVQSFVNDLSITVPVVLDTDGRVATQLYRLYGVPMTVVIDRDGIIMDRYLGQMTTDHLQTMLQTVLPDRDHHR